MMSTGHSNKREVCVTYMYMYIRLYTYCLCTAFTKWLNHILAPVDDHGKILHHEGKSGMSKRFTECIAHVSVYLI